MLKKLKKTPQKTHTHTNQKTFNVYYSNIIFCFVYFLISYDYRTDNICMLIGILIDWLFIYSAILCFWADSVQLQMTVIWHRAFFESPPKWCSYNAVWLLHCWYHIKLLPCWRMFCVLHTAMHHFTFLVKDTVTYMQSACVFWLWPATKLLAQWLECFPCHCSNPQGWNRHRDESTQKVDVGEENSLLLLPGIEPMTFQSYVRHFATELSMSPNVFYHLCLCVSRVCSNIWGSLMERTAMLSIVPSAGLKLLIVLGDTHWSVAFLCVF